MPRPEMDAEEQKQAAMPWPGTSHEEKPAEAVLGGDPEEQEQGAMPRPGTNHEEEPDEVGLGKQVSCQGRKSQTKRLSVMNDPDYFLNNFSDSTFNFVDAQNVAVVLPEMIFAFLCVVDRNGNGNLVGHDLEEAADILKRTLDAKENNTPELSYKHLPDSVANVLKEWDSDQSGSVGLAELMNLDAAMKKMKNENRMVKRLLMGTVIVILILMGGMFALSFTAAEMAKEMRGSGDGVMKTSSGKVAAMGGVQEVASLAGFVDLEPKQLKMIKDIGFMHNEDFHHYQVASFKLNQNKKALQIKSIDGMVLTIKETADGSVPIQFQQPGESIVTLDDGGARRLSAGASDEGVPARRLWGEAEQSEDPNGRRMFGGGLVTGGSFSMMASGGM